MGDRNTIPSLEDEKLGLVDARYCMNPLLENAHNVSSGIHYGPRTTFAGFGYDHYKNPIDQDGRFTLDKVLDFIISSDKAAASAYVLPTYDHVFTTKYSEERNFASDHFAVIGFYSF
jgi:hypothetical protein